MVRNGSHIPNMSYFFKPLVLYVLLFFPISLKCWFSHFIPWPLASWTLYYICHCPFYLLRTISNKCHFYEHSRVSQSFPSASMALYTHLLQTFHIVLWLLNRSYPSHSDSAHPPQLVGWHLKNQRFRMGPPSFLNPQGLAQCLQSDNVNWEDGKNSFHSRQERREDQIPWFGESLCTSTFTTFEFPTFKLF